jgi:hypothetical protein
MGPGSLIWHYCVHDVRPAVSAPIYSRFFPPASGVCGVLLGGYGSAVQAMEPQPHALIVHLLVALHALLLRARRLQRLRRQPARIHLPSPKPSALHKER